jgi:hypothetical protein
MMIFSDWVFLRVPKAAGNLVVNQLHRRADVTFNGRERIDGDWVDRAHVRNVDFRRTFPAAIQNAIASRPTYAMWRDPVERFCSAFKWCRASRTYPDDLRGLYELYLDLREGVIYPIIWARPISEFVLEDTEFIRLDQVTDKVAVVGPRDKVDFRKRTNQRKGWPTAEQVKADHPKLYAWLRRYYQADYDLLERA